MKRINILNLIFSIFLSISINLKLVIDKNLDYFIKKFHIDIMFIIKVILLSILIYFLLKVLFLLFDKIPLKNKKLILDKKKTILIFISIFITSMLYLIVYYPATFLNDTLYMLYGPLHRGSPIIYGIFMSILFFSLKSFVTPTIAVFIMSIIQAIVASIILTYVITWFNKRFNNEILTIILICYYVFMPIIASYNIALNKDSPFSLMILLFFVFIFEIVESKGKVLTDKKFLLNIFLASIFASYIRNNGLFVVLTSLLIVFSIYGFKKYRKQSLIVLSLVVMFSFVPPIASKLLHAEHLKREWYTVPIQQVGYLGKYHSNRLTDEDYKVLSKFINNPKKTLKKHYDVFTVDELKFNKNFDRYKFNDYSKEFLHLWISKYPNNISPYTKSYLLNSYHLWSINKFDRSQSVIYGTAVFGIKKSRHIYHKEILPKNIQEKLLRFYYKTCVYLNPAACFILLLIINLYALERKKKDIVVLSVPLLSLWFVLILGSPYSSALRYMAPYIYILPILMLYTFKITRKDVRNGLSRKSKK